MVLSVQYLRGAAALLVVYFHAANTPGFALGAEKAGFAFGECGVDIFFVISGFIMCYTTIIAPLAPSEFMKRRLIRIVPLYWLVTLAMFIMPLISKSIALGKPILIPNFIASLIFWGGLESTYPPGWTLNYEMFFYLIFSLGLFFQRTSVVLLAIPGFLVFVVLLGTALRLAGSDAEPSLAWINFYASPIVIEFCFGIAIGWLFSRKLVLAPWLALATIIASTIALGASNGVSGLDRLIFFGVPSACLVLGVVSLECSPGMMPSSKFLQLLGDASYSIYLTHVFAIGALFVAWHRLGLRVQMSAIELLSFVVIGLVVSVLLGIMTHLWIELPLIRFVQNRWPSRSRHEVGR